MPILWNEDQLVPRMDDINKTYQIYKVYFQGEGSTRGIGFTKVNDQWKFVAVFALGGTHEKPTYKMNLWP